MSSERDSAIPNTPEVRLLRLVGKFVVMAAAGRARWKIANEAFNTPKTRGYNLGHNFGHGDRHLASVLAILNLIALACHMVCHFADKSWKAARRESVVRNGIFHTLDAPTASGARSLKTARSLP